MELYFKSKAKRTFQGIFMAWINLQFFSCSLIFLYFIIEMNQDDSSFRDFYHFPSPNSKMDKQPRKHKRKRSGQEEGGRKESFDKFVRKTKNVVMFAQKLKQQIGKKHIFNIHTLTSNELQYLENQSSEVPLATCFSCESKWISTFQFIFVTILMVFAWKSSFELVFQELSSLLVINILTIGVFIVEVLVFCFTQYQTEMGKTINDCRQIWQIYFQDNFLKDIVTLILIIVQTTRVDQNLSSIGVPVIVRLIVVFLVFNRMKQGGSHVQNAISLSNNAQTIIAMVKLLFKIFILLHFLSLLLNVLADVEISLGETKTWLNDNSFKAESNLERYVVGWYWGATILSSVGFGDITPSNHIERFFISIVQIFCCLSFGYFVNVIGSLIKLRTERDQKSDKQNRSVNRYLNTLTLTQDLKFKIRSFFLNQHKVEQKLDTDEEQVVLEHLNEPLKCSLLEENNLTVLKRSIKFQRLKSGVMSKLALVLKRVVFAPEHIIYSRGNDDIKLWLIESGKVDEYTNNFKDCPLEKKIARYDSSSDSAVGWMNFLTQNKYSTLAKTSEFTVAYELDENKFRSTLSTSTKDWYKFMEMKQLLVQNKKKYIQKCLSCDRYTHNVIDCPRIHFIRKDVLSMVAQLKNFQKFKLGIRKKKKYQRETIRMGWKKDFDQEHILGKQNIIQHKREERVSSLGMSIDVFLKNLTKISSNKLISNKKIRRLESKNSQFDEIDFKEISYNLNKSLDQVLPVEEEEIAFDAVLMDKDNKEYLPHHNIEDVLKGISKTKIQHSKQLIGSRKD